MAEPEQKPEVAEQKVEVAEKKVEATEVKKNMDLFICMVGADKHMIDRDLVKFFRKSFGHKDDEVLPLKGVSKKRMQAFAFLEFADAE